MALIPDDGLGHARQTVRDAARDAHHAARAASRQARRAAFRASCGQTQWFFPALLITMGIIFLLDNLNIIESRYIFRNLWPLAVLAFGLLRLFFGTGGERVFGAVASMFGGLWLAERVFDVDINVIGTLWPLILIGLGISMLYGRRGWAHAVHPHGAPPIPPSDGTTTPPPVSGFASTPSSGTQAQEKVESDAGYVDQSARVKETAFLANVERRNISQVFRSGELSAFMGSIELDLRDCRMSEPSATVDIQVIMGQVILRLPPDWTVESHLGTFLGNLEDRSDRPVDTNPKRLTIHGSVFMGQVELRN